MADPFSIPESGYEGLGYLVEMGPTKLKQLAEWIARQDLTLDFGALAEDTAEELKYEGGRDQTEAMLFNVLVPLSGIRVDLHMAPKAFVDLLAGIIQRQNPEWYKEHETGWGEISEPFSELIGRNGYFGQLNKLNRLANTRPNVVHDFKILTELRPVYDEDVTATQLMLLTSTLVVDYIDNGESKRIHLTVGRRDLQTLQEQLDRAEKKAHLLEEQGDKLGVPVLVAGTERE